MKRFLYALVAMIATLSLSVGVRSAAWASGSETWKIVPIPNPAGLTSSGFYGVAAVSPHDACGVGYWQNATTNAPHIEHWNGSQWSVVASPNVAEVPGSFLPRVAIVSPRDVWAVGYVRASQTTVLIINVEAG